MAVTTAQRQGMLQRGMELARRLHTWNKEFDAFKDEYDAESYGTEITQANIDAYANTNGLDLVDFTSCVGGMDSVSTSFTTNRTSIMKFAAQTSTP